MDAYKENPQSALAALEKIAEEIPSGVSCMGDRKMKMIFYLAKIRNVVMRYMQKTDDLNGKNVAQILTVTGPCPNEITDGIKENITVTLKEKINAFWVSHKISEKLSDVKNLKCSDEDTSRYPLSPQEMLTSTRTSYLEVLKEELRARINKLKEENSELERVVEQKSILMQQQMNEVESCEFVL